MNIHILGAGLVGSLLGIYLAKKGYQIDIYERRADFRKVGYIGGRSINLAMSNRGLQGLAGVGLAEEVQKIGLLMTHRAMHDTKGNITQQPYGQAEQGIYAVSRGKLNEFLLNEIDKLPNVNIHFEQRCMEVDLQNSTFELENSANHTTKKIQADILLGADGAFSALRNAFIKTDKVNYSQEYLKHGYKELSIPPKNNKHQLSNNALHIWPRGGFMFIALPNLDGSFTCTLFLSFEGEQSFANLKDTKSVETFFETFFPDIIPLVPDFVEQFFENPTSSLVTIKTSPWVFGHNIALIGDAAHAIVPFYGQGMNAGFEDCYVLDKLLTKENGNWETTLAKYQHERIENANAIAELAVMNFVEMRDLVGKNEFLLRKKIEAKLHELYPTVWIPLYTMVTFRADISYSEALRLGKIQDEIMQQVMQQTNIENNWQTLDFEEIIRKYETKKV
jgi:kynurenine 3-monooxygenase